MVSYNPADDHDKMRALVQFAGSIAGPLMTIGTSLAAEAEILLRPNSRQHLSASVALIKRNARTVNEIVDGLLEFASQSVVCPQVLSVAKILGQLSPLLRRLTSLDVELMIDCSNNLSPVCVDVAQLERVLCSLVVYGHTAMPNGGVIKIQVDNIGLANSCGEFSDHVRIKISYQGRAVLPFDRIFEPVLTKSGFGLSLNFATVFGAVTQMHGQIVIELNAPQGCCFVVLLPAYVGNPAARSPRR